MFLKRDNDTSFFFVFFLMPLEIDMLKYLGMKNLIKVLANKRPEGVWLHISQLGPHCHLF